ncbi:MAG: BatD family protein [Bacteroidales bacterium]|nr:BatD family protein [Bacteroidales bacterium]
MKRLCIVWMLLCSAFAALAQNTLTVDAPKVVTADENFRIVFTANGRMSDFNWPGSDQISILWGPQSGSMSSTSIVNGKRTSTHQETYTYIVQALSEGTITLPAATATVGKESCTTGEFKIEVVSGEKRAQAASDPNAGAAAAATTEEKQNASAPVGSGDIFLRLSVSKTQVVKGEPLVATLKLYTRVDVTGFEEVHFPTFNGFWSKETESAQNVQFERENVGGTIYNAAVLRRYMLIPQRTGSVTIDPAEMVCQIRVLGDSGPRSFFDSFFDSYQTVRKRLKTDAVKIQVKPLPEGAPASFAGGVGDFKMNAVISKQGIKAHEAASLVVTITGRGNISMLEAPRVSFPPDFEVYDLKSTEKISADGTSGTKTFEFPFIPRSHGDFTIEPIRYSYYDIAKGRYVTLSSEPLSISVEKGEEIESGGVVVPGVARQGVRNLAEDIRFIHTGASGLRKEGAFFAGSSLYWLLIAAISVITLLLALFFRAAAARRRDVVGMRNRRANKVARTRLHQAGDYLKRNLNSAYYEELHKAVLGYVSDKLTIPAADLSKDRIAEAFAERGVESSLSGRLIHILDACEFARYAPDTEQAEREGLYNEALNVISELEGQVKTNRKQNQPLRKGALLFAALLCLGTFTARAAEDSRWEEAAAAYTSADYATALDTYRSIADEGLVSADLWYNIAGCYFKLGDIPHAILYYEKCLKLAPAHADARNNLDICRQFTLDKIDEIPPFLLVTWLKKVKYAFSADAWAWISVALALVVAALLLGFRFFSRLGARKVSFIFACIVALLALAALYFSLSEKSDALRSDAAVMIQPVSTVKSSPGEGGKSIFVLHEGTKVELLDTLGEWIKIELSDGRQGWVEASVLEKI